jgi:hypothetical protein
MEEQLEGNRIGFTKCPICGNPADKTNTHLIPWFIIKHYVTQDGAGVRDKELSFNISSGHFTKMFAGRSVLPEKIEEFGDLHELEKEQSNPYARDRHWCSNCEEKFSRLEAIFASQLREDKVRAEKNLPTHHSQHICVDKRFENSIYQLFIQSMFWRCSVGKFAGFTMNKAIENRLTENLREAFKHPDFLRLKAGDQVPLIHRFPVVTSLMYAKPGEDQTKNYVMISNAKLPYFIMAGKWLFQLYAKEQHIRSSQEWQYGLRDALDTPSLYPKIKDTSHVILLTESDSERFYNNRLNSVVEKKRLGVLNAIRMAHRHMFGHKPPLRIEYYIYNQYLKHHNTSPEFESFLLAFLDLKNL